MKTRHLQGLLFGFFVSLFCFSSVTLAFVEPEAAQNGKAKSNNASKAENAKEKAKKQPEYAKDRLIVKYKKNTSNHLADIRKFNERKSKLKVDGEHRRLKRLGKAKRTEVLQVPEGSDIQELAGLYSSDPNVEYAEPDFMVSALMEPNDPSFPLLWGLQNDGSSQNANTSTGVVDADINAPEAWDITTGDENVVVAIIDSGIFYTHPELADNIWVNPGEIAGNVIDDDNNGYIDDIHGINTLYDHGDPMDDQGHGTHVAGTIGARGNNALGVAGVNWNVKMIGCKFLDKGPGYGYLSDAIECLDYLLELKTRSENPVDIVATNNSWGGGGYSQALSDAILAHEQAGILFVAAAGNSSANIDSARSYPAGYPHIGIVSVAATRWNDNLASFSNYGLVNVDVAAPGENILSTVPMQRWDDKCRLCTESGYKWASGTSMATPHVTGLVALLKAQDPTRNLVQLRNLILTSGTPLPQLQGFTLSGRRIRAAGVNGTGALTCDNQHVQRKLTPNAELLGMTTTSQINFQIYSITCDGPSEGLIVTVTPGNESIVLHDDGQGTDEVADDNIFSATYTPAFGDTFTFPDGSEMSTAPIGGYRYPVSIPYTQYSPPDPYVDGVNYWYGRQIWEPAIIQTPFPIPFGGVSPGYTQMYANSNGTISFDGAATGNNGTLPHPSLQTLIAPFWDNLTSAKAHDGLNFWASAAWSVGEAPHRRFIVHFDPLGHTDLVSLQGYAPDTVSFQVVFFEDSADIVFNYIDTKLGDGNIYSPAHSYGASATIGIQTAPDIYKHFSVNTSTVVVSGTPIGSGKSLRWQFVGIEADAGKNATVVSGDQVWLDGSESSAIGGVVHYQWTQVSGTPVTFNNANNKRANFIAPAKSTLEFELTVTDANGATASDRVIIKTSARPIANAGSDQFLLFDFSDYLRNINLNGSQSVDPDGSIVRYQWVILDQPQMSIPNPNSAQTSLGMGELKTLRIQLTVTDDSGLQSSDIVVINSNMRPLSYPWPGTYPGGTVYTNQTYTLDGSRSQDYDGHIVSYQWQQISGPTVQINNANNAMASFVAPATATELIFKLTVTDNEGATGAGSSFCLDYCFDQSLSKVTVRQTP